MTVPTATAIRALLAEHGVQPSRALGQHFLADPNTSRRIARLAGVREGSRVLEIGPGVGSLTTALAETGAQVLALELDRYVLPLLDEVLTRAGTRDHVRVVPGDALDADLDALLGAGPWACVSNLPYNVAVPIVARLLDDVPAVTELLVMVQREVGERLAAPPGTRASGTISVKVAYYGTAEVVGLVPPTVFVPPPKVDSALVRIVRHAAPPVDVPDRAALFALVAAGYGQRRKMLRGALQSALGRDATAVLEAAGVDPTRRAEALTLADWASVARAAASGARG